MITTLHHSHDDGFSLVELMITLVITALISSGIFAAYRAQQSSYVLQEQVVEMQQRVRAGVDMMVMELREAGYNPYGETEGIKVEDIGILYVGKEAVDVDGDSDDDVVTIVTFGLSGDNDDVDNDGNGKTDEAEEIRTLMYSFNEITYSGNDTNATSIEKNTEDNANRSVDIDIDNPDVVPTDARKLIEDIELVELVFIDEDGDPLPVLAVGESYDDAEMDSIRAVTISILVRSTTPNPKIVKQNKTYTLGSGVVTPAYTDQFRRSLLITTVMLRNLGE